MDASINASFLGICLLGDMPITRVMVCVCWEMLDKLPLINFGWATTM